MVLCIANQERRLLLDEIQEQAAEDDVVYSLGDNICEVRRRRGGLELRIKWTCLDDEKYISGNHWIV